MSMAAQLIINAAQAQQAQTEKNISTILALPWEQCPWPSVRLALLRLAIEGAEVYAYRPAHQREWVIWQRQAHPGSESRISPRQWAMRHGYAVDDSGKEGA